MSGFRTLVDASSVHEHLNDAAWLIVDCRHSLADLLLGRRLYDEGHLPGAIFADVEHDLSGAATGHNGRHPLPEREAFAEFLRAHGCNDTTQLVAYDAGADMFAARFWFLARWIGHADVAVLDGGTAAWQAAGFPLVTGAPRSSVRGTLSVRAQLDGTLDARQVAALLSSSRCVLVDARAPERYRGDVEPIDPVAGHIPGARNRSFKENYDERGRMKSAAALRQEFAAFSHPEHIVHYCGSGISAAANLLAMLSSGLEGMRLYPGSWSEWCADPTRPVERGENSG